MKDLLYCLNSVEEAYSDSHLTGIIQIQERITDIETFVGQNHQQLNVFEKQELVDRLNKLVEYNASIRRELEEQATRLANIEQKMFSGTKNTLAQN